MGPSVYMVLGWWAHPSTLHSVGGPIHLYCTQLVGPVISIIHTPLAHPSLMYTILHWPIPFHWVHTTHLAHSSIMVQLPLWAEVGWPISIGTLSPLAARLRQVCVTALCVLLTSDPFIHHFCHISLPLPHLDILTYILHFSTLSYPFVSLCFFPL